MVCGGFCYFCGLGRWIVRGKLLILVVLLVLIVWVVVVGRFGFMGDEIQFEEVGKRNGEVYFSE